MKKLVVLILINTVLAACSSPYSSTGENVYMKAQNAEMLRVPPPLTSSHISSFYVLPPQTQNAVVSLVPE